MHSYFSKMLKHIQLSNLLWETHRNFDSTASPGKEHILCCLFHLTTKCALTSSNQMPYVPAKIFPIDNRRTFTHGFRFLCVWPGALSTHYTWHAIVLPDMYMHNCFLEVLGGSWFGGPGQKTLQTMNEFTLFVDFCLIPLSKTCPFDIPAKKL